jgi:hypothetical protein
MGKLWYPGAERLQEQHNGSFTGGPAKGLLHSTEVGFGRGWAHYRPGTKPHLEVIGLPAERKIAVRQFYPLNQPARALADGPGAVRTNRDGVIQIELGLRAVDVEQVPAWFWSQLRSVLRWVEDKAGVNPDRWAKFLAYPQSYGDSSVRMTAREWDSFDGWCGHQHVPENSHGDPGKLPIRLLRRNTETFHKVKAGESLRAIADAHGISVFKLLRLNAKIKPGDRLRVR